MSLEKAQRIALSIVILAASTAAQDPASAATAALKFHNDKRDCHGVPRMTLDTVMNADALKCAKYYAGIGGINHTCNAKLFGGKWSYGENLAWESTGDLTAVAVSSCGRWYNESKLYDYKNGPNDNTWASTGHFTQMVWDESIKLGFGQAAGGGRIYSVGLYSPPGNFKPWSNFLKHVFPPGNSCGGTTTTTTDNGGGSGTDDSDDAYYYYYYSSREADGKKRRRQN